MKYSIFALLILFVFSSCNKEKKQAKKDDEIIQEYLKSHNLSATKTDTGLYIVINDAGIGASCHSTSNVTVAYKGYFTDDSVFDESDAAGATFNLSGVIEGWTEGIPYFKEGGNGKLLIPSALGYGTTQKGPIPANSVLIFDINLIDVL